MTDDVENALIYWTARKQRFATEREILSTYGNSPFIRAEIDARKQCEDCIVERLSALSSMAHKQGYKRAGG